MRDDSHLMGFADAGSAFPLTELLAQSVAAAPDQCLSDADLVVVRRIVVDWLGVAIAGSTEPVARLMRAEFGSDTGATSFLRARGRASVADAALINATAGHALDYDDVHPLIGHPGAVVVPAALAVGETVAADGELFARAIIAGYDAAHFVGSLVMPSHYDHGFHSTATVGTFGAVAAAAALMRLDPPTTRNAIGLAATQAAGLKCMFGSMAKPFHAGRACAAGVTAARLAARGMTAHPESLETAQGFLSTQAHQPMPSDWSPLSFGASLSQLLFKQHASCYLTHSSIEAVRSIMTQRGLLAQDVAHVSLRVPAGHLNVCNIDEPDTGLESKFSLRQVIALTLGGYDTADVAIFSDRLARNEEMRNLRQRVLVQGDLDPGFEARATLRTQKGHVFSALHDTTLASSNLPADLDDKLDKKFAALTEPVLGNRAVQAILTMSYAMPDCSLTRLLAVLETSSRGELSAVSANGTGLGSVSV